MYLKHLVLKNFRSYIKSEFKFSSGTTLIVGPNTAGKTNLLEACYLLATGKSFRAEKEREMIAFGESIARVKGIEETETLEVVLSEQDERGFLKKYLINGVSKRRVDFVGNLSSVLFSPLDLEILIGTPSIRRNFIDEVLEQVDRDYRIALSSYVKALRQRNALLEIVRETGKRSERQFEYWDHLLISNGKTVTEKREAFIDFINSKEKPVFDFAMIYDKSTISKERLLQYEKEEVLASATLVGPHRDDFLTQMYNDKRGQTHNVRLFGSRGQQRLVMLQLKLIELSFIEKITGERPLLLLDDIFSELDESHIDLVLGEISHQQTIITTTHKEFVKKPLLKKMDVIKLQ